jgi:hypothetical protein
MTCQSSPHQKKRASEQCSGGTNDSLPHRQVVAVADWQPAAVHSNFIASSSVKLEGRLISVDWIQLAQDRDRWRALGNMAMNLRILAPRS